MATIAATVLAAGIFVGSQPPSTAASDEMSQSASDSRVSLADRIPELNGDASRGERNAPVEQVPVQAAPLPNIPVAQEALVPELDAAGSADGPNGSAALTGVPCPSGGFGGVKPHVAQAGYHLIAVFGLSESVVGGLAQRPGSYSDHPRGYALDFMVDTATGNAMSDYIDKHSSELGIKYVLWQVANHYDHVHISFNNSAGSGMSC